MEGYWKGPYDVFVPNHINCVVASDGYNFLNKNGTMTKKLPSNTEKMTAELYRCKYAILINDKWIYDEESQRIMDGSWKSFNPVKACL